LDDKVELSQLINRVQDIQRAAATMRHIKEHHYGKYRDAIGRSQARCDLEARVNTPESTMSVKDQLELAQQKYEQIKKQKAREEHAKNFGKGGKKKKKKRSLQKPKEKTNTTESKSETLPSSNNHVQVSPKPHSSFTLHASSPEFKPNAIIVGGRSFTGKWMDSQYKLDKMLAEVRERAFQACTFQRACFSM
jgi:hypothetical protein